jgi:hypothetical protein
MNLAEIHNYTKVVTTGTISPLLSPNIKNTIFWFYISKDELHTRLRVRTALLMQILVFLDRRGVEWYIITNFAEWPAASFFRTTELGLRYVGPVARMGFRSA